MSDATIRWTLRHDGRSITCTEHSAPGGLEVRVTYDSLPLAAQHCDRVEDAVRWSERIRERWEATGWSRDSPDDSRHQAA